jgi:hypothetical protein
MPGSNKLFYVCYSEGDAILQESRVIMAVTVNMRRAEEMFLRYFREKKLPAFTYHTAQKIIHGNVLSRLDRVNIRFITQEKDEKEEETRRAAEWDKIRDKIDGITLDKEIIEEIFYENLVVS